MDETYILADPAQAAGGSNKSAPTHSSLNSLKEEPGGFYNYRKLPELRGCACMCRLYIFVCL